ncbi:flavin monoamine oxidase family protein [Streptomyces sp. NPDC096311]|uniref:flavin monoamine oxidase family protein n=1 Tax=Streptomyces sp. NPDC096311 TaxID=3366083 RepID=UPI00381AE2A6
MTHEPDYDVIVVGAGFAGATATRDLRDRGLSVLLLEAGDRLGGRAYSRRFEGRDDIVIECGGGWVNPDLHHNVAAELDRYGIALTSDEEEDPARAVFFTGGELRPLPVPVGEFGDLEGAWIRLYEAAKRFSVGYRVHQQQLADLDVSAHDFFAPLGLPDATRDFLYALLASFAGTHPDESSILWPISKIAAYGYGPYGLLSGQTVKSGCSQMFAKGTGELVHAMVEGSGAEVQLSSRVTHITRRARGVDVTTTSGERFTARGCVVAVPSNVIRRIEFNPPLHEDKVAATSAGHPGRAYKTFMIVEGVSQAPICFGLAGLQMVLPLKELEDGRWLLVGFGADGVQSLDPCDEKSVEAALRTYLPEARVVACDGHDWNQDPFYEGTYHVDSPGHALGFPHIMNQPEGPVVFAGADIDDSIWRNSFESAIHTGHQAARYITSLVQRQRAA